MSVIFFFRKTHPYYIPNVWVEERKFAFYFGPNFGLDPAFNKMSPIGEVHLVDNFSPLIIIYIKFHVF